MIFGEKNSFFNYLKRNNKMINNINLNNMILKNY